MERERTKPTSQTLVNRVICLDSKERMCDEKLQIARECFVCIVGTESKGKKLTKTE